MFYFLLVSLPFVEKPTQGVHTAQQRWSNTDDVIYFIDLLYSAMGGEAQTAGLANNEYSGSIFTSIYRASINAKMDVVSRIKALIIVGSWSCHWSTVTLFEEFDEDHKRHIKNAETVFAKALEIINDNSISDETLINDLCKPYVWAFMKSKYSAIFHLFSGNLIDQLINLNPICLRNEQVTPQNSFLIRVLLNEEYESKHDIFDDMLEFSIFNEVMKDEKDSDDEFDEDFDEEDW